MMNDDMELVRAYAASRSEQAFETLVGRYVNFVYSTALRQVRDTHLAEEVTQAVFIILARKAGTLGAKTILPSWLYRTAGYCAADALKMQRRREQREQEAYMQSQLNEPENEVWLQIAPLLDKAISGLNEKDRHAIVLRFFQNKSLNETGAALGASEEAAKKRVNRAVEKLRVYFSRHGVHSTAQTIAGAMSANSVITAPVLLAKAITTVGLAQGAAAPTSTLTLMKGALKIMAWTKAKTAIVTGVVVLLAAGTTTLVIVKQQHPIRSMSGTNPGDFAPDKASLMAQMQSVKMTFIPAFIQYAQDHNDYIPPSMAELKAYLPPDTNGMGYDNWEILATGKLTPQLQQHDTVLFRQKQVPEGQYHNLQIIGYTDGHLETKNMYQ
jgi:RNA polymerase sigma factor (sigma-70 family)